MCRRRLRDERQWPSEETESRAHRRLAPGVGIKQGCGHREEGDLTGGRRGAAGRLGQEGALFSPRLVCTPLPYLQTVFLWVQPFDVDHTAASVAPCSVIHLPSATLGGP